MTPLLDVIFLLLTFFIYSIVVTVRAQVLPVKLPALTTGEMRRDVAFAGITVDREGRLSLNQQPITRAALEARLIELAAEADPPVFALAIEDAPGAVDRGPILIDMIELFRKLGIGELNIVGAPRVTEKKRD